MLVVPAGMADEHIRVLLKSIKTDWIACADPETVSGGGGGGVRGYMCLPGGGMHNCDIFTM